MTEWRDHISEQGDGTPILLLPFVANEAIVQGQSKSIILKEGRFYDLFQDCIDDYESIVGMVLMGDDGLLGTMPLCEIHDFDVQAGFRGKVTVSVTLLAVGRAKIVEFLQMKPIMIGVCEEMVDRENVDVSLANELVNDIETTINDMNRVENGITLKQCYDRAFELALETDSQGYVLTSDANDERSIGELTATSWAVFTCLSNKSSLYKAIAATSLTDRLELGLKALLDEKYQANAILPREMDGDVGFE